MPASAPQAPAAPAPSARGGGRAAAASRSPPAERSSRERAAARRRCAGRAPRACAAPLQPPGKRAGRRAARRSGCSTVGDLLEHLPQRQPRGAHGRRRCGAGEQATVAVRCARSPRARCAGAGCARSSRRRVFDATGSMRATFFNQPWLVERYPPGTRLLLHGKADGRGRLRVSHHALGAAELGDAHGRAGGAGESVAHYPATEGVSSTQILTLVQASAARARATSSSRCRPRTRVAERLPDRAAALAAMHFPRDARGRRGGPRAAGLRGAAADAARCSCAAARGGAPRSGAPALRRAAVAERALARARAAVRADRRPARGDRDDRRGPRASRARCSGC